MKNRALNFLRNDDGAGIVAMAVAVFLSMETGALELTSDVNGFMDSQDPN